MDSRLSMNPFQEFFFQGSLFSFFVFLSLLLISVKNKLSLVKQVWGATVLSMIWLGLVLMNLLGLIGYSWAWSMYPILSFFLALMIWSIFCLSSTLFLTSKWLYRSGGHYLPLSSPSWLWLFLPLIEVISQVIRPLTLTLRLSANLVAGHSILFLIGCLPWFSLSFLGFLIFVPFELMVAFVQGVVFCLLLQTYSLER